jgi:ribonuclease E
MLIDSAHSEEIRIAVVDGEKLDKFDFETPSKAQIKGNIYLGKIVSVEPSLQAAFVDFGNGKHGFLGFSEIHHDYFQIPVGDRDDLEARIQSAIAAKIERDGESEEGIDPREISKLRYQFYRQYKIQEVIKKRQIVLVQVTKEERGTKGAALTTYISLAGRYCVLMPNMSKGSGVSRKISNNEDRIKLKKIVSELNVKNGSTIIRTAGVGHSKVEIKKDFDYLTKLWAEICATTLKSTAPSLIHEEASIIKRAIRDLYTRDIESIIIEGEEGYKTAKDYMKKLIPSHSKKVKLYDDKKVPLFSKFKVNDQINQIYSTHVSLPSGGYIVINTTEALISIDVNSGRSTKERNVGGTALKTNLEAAVEISRQCRLRDLAGLIVVDFIDMEEKRNNGKVERCLREALREDKAKIQVGSISSFGLLEFSRQRLRSSIVDAHMVVCQHCMGVGAVWSYESIALMILREIEETCSALDISEVSVTLSAEVALYLLNNKRNFIESIEKKGLKINFNIDSSIAAADFKISQVSKSEELEKSISQKPERRPKRIAHKHRREHYDNENRDEKAESHEVLDETQAGDKESGEIAPEEPEKTQNLNVHTTKSSNSRSRWNNRRRRRENFGKTEAATPPAVITDISAQDQSPTNEQSSSNRQVFDLTAIKKAKNRIDKKTSDDKPKDRKESAKENDGADSQNKKENNEKKKEDNGKKFALVVGNGDGKTSRSAAADVRSPDSRAAETPRGDESKDGDNAVTVVREIDLSQEQNELKKLAKTYRKLKEELENISTSATENVSIDHPVKKKKKGWWQRLIKKPNTDAEVG